MSEPAIPARDVAAETRRLLALAWPVVLTSLNWTILHVTDVVVVGLVSTEQAAALGASRALTFIGIVAVLGWLTGILVFASRADGARDLPTTGRVFQEGLVLGLALGLAAGALLFAFAEPMLLAIGVAPAIAPDAAAVVRVMALAYPFQTLIIAASFFLEGVSRPRRVTVVNFITLPVNAVLAWALSGGHAGLPALGAVGAAAATAIASVLGAALMIGAALTLARAEERGVRRWRATGEGVRRLAAFGLVPAIASALELAGFSVLIALSTRLGEAATHAFQIVFSIHNVTFALALGMGSAAGVRAGNAVGEGLPREAPWRATIATALAAAATGVCALILLVFDRSVTGAFPAAAEVHVLAAAMLLVWAPFILFDGMQVVLVYTLRSLGDQVAAGLNGIAAFFVVTGGLGWLLVEQGVGPMALVWASGIGMVAAALFNGLRLGWVSRRL
ncbi:MATE family efflux transporter [Sphingomonas cannabina]|uniref:MATE family efflux transporter n=1 Tax=Sphingomonas cannabina TaxID=2899123 RepID=UPI001F360E17|nr:MATE family efflux transporter [Sphingomonas cannabina]UIJ45466.1 MATE family efflux transporter [Sphingomonas cannabina]